MASVVSFLSGPVTRTWRVGPRLLAVTLNHNTITGSRSLSIDSSEVLGSVGSFNYFSSPLELLFRVDGHEGRVLLSSESGNVIYRCIVKTPHSETAEEVPEENSLGAGLGSEYNKLRLSIDAWDVGLTSRAVSVVYFRVRSIREADERGTVVHRRFRDFIALNEAVRAAYMGSQLLGSFPEPPPRGMFLLENQDDHAFRERRRWLCADFLCECGVGVMSKVESRGNVVTW